MWFNLPEDSPESNDSIILQNYGDEDMPWVVDMIDNNASFETDPFYSVHLRPNTAASFDSEMEVITVFNMSVHDSAVSVAPVSRCPADLSVDLVGVGVFHGKSYDFQHVQGSSLGVKRVAGIGQHRLRMRWTSVS